MVECDLAIKQFLLHLGEKFPLGSKFIIQDHDDSHLRLMNYPYDFPPHLMNSYSLHCKLNRLPLFLLINPMPGSQIWFGAKVNSVMSQQTRVGSLLSSKGVRSYNLTLCSIFPENRSLWSFFTNTVSIPGGPGWRGIPGPDSAWSWFSCISP